MESFLIRLGWLHVGRDTFLKGWRDVNEYIYKQFKVGKIGDFWRI